MPKLSQEEKEKLFHESIGIAYHALKKYTSEGMSEDYKKDLRQACLKGLWESLDKYEPDRSEKDSLYTFAHFFMQEECLEVMRHQRSGISIKRCHWLRRKNAPENIPKEVFHLDGLSRSEVEDWESYTPDEGYGDLSKIISKVCENPSIGRGVEETMRLLSKGLSEKQVGEYLKVSRGLISNRKREFINKAKELHAKGVI